MAESTEQARADGVYLWAEDIVSIESFDDCEERLIRLMSEDERNVPYIPPHSDVVFFCRSNHDKKHDMIRGNIYLGIRSHATRKLLLVAPYKCYKLPYKEALYVLPAFISAQGGQTNLAEFNPEVQIRRRQRDAKLLEDARRQLPPSNQLVASSSWVKPLDEERPTSRTYYQPRDSATYPRAMVKVPPRAATDPHGTSTQVKMPDPRKTMTGFTSKSKETLKRHGETVNRWFRKSISKKS